MTEKSNLELARDAGVVRTKHTTAEDCYELWAGQLNYFAALVEQRYRERLLGVKVEPVAHGVFERDSGRVWYINESQRVCGGYADNASHRDDKGFDQVVKPLYTADQCAAMMAQAAPLRLLRDFLAVIHCDDGSHTEQHGLEKSVQDAQAKWYARIAPTRLTREEAQGLWLRCKAIDNVAFCAEFAGAIQDALGIKEPDHG